MALVNGIGEVNGYRIGRGVDLRKAKLSGADLQGANLYGADLRGANLFGANFAYATVDPAHVPLIEEAKRSEIESLRVNGGRTSNPGHRHHRRGYGR